MAKPKRIGFFIYEDDDEFFYEDDPVVGSLFSNVDPPRRRFWQKRTDEPKKPAFGFSRVLED